MDELDLPTGWRWVLGEEANQCELRLRENMVASHPLFTIPTSCLAQLRDTDEFLFMVDGQPGTPLLAILQLNVNPGESAHCSSDRMFNKFVDFRKGWRRILERQPLEPNP